MGAPPNIRPCRGESSKKPDDSKATPLNFDASMGGSLNSRTPPGGPLRTSDPALGAPLKPRRFRENFSKNPTLQWGPLQISDAPTGAPLKKNRRCNGNPPEYPTLRVEPSLKIRRCNGNPSGYRHCAGNPSKYPKLRWKDL